MTQIEYTCTHGVSRMPIETTTSNQIAQHYDREVEDMLRAADLSRYMGTDVLNPVQAEVNNFNMAMERLSVAPEATASQLQESMRQSLYKVRLAVKEVQNNMVAKHSNLGSVGGQMSMLDSSAWSNTLSEVAMKIEEIGGQYGKVIVNQPDKDNIDRMMANTLESIETAYKQNPSPSNAATAKMKAITSLNSIAAMLEQRKGALLQSSLSNLVSQKEIELLNTVSVLKMNADSLSKHEMDVINMHSTKATEQLAKIKSDPMSYDKAIMQQHLRVFEQILAPLTQMRESVQYRSALSGGNFSSPRRPASQKTYGFGSVPKRRYHEHQTDNPTNNSPFRVAPDVAMSIRGLGNVGDSVSTQMKRVDPNTENLDSVTVDTLNSNLEIASAQGYISPADEAILREQLSSLNIAAFGGDQQLYESSKSAIRNTIDHYSQMYKDKAASGAIDANIPSGSSEKQYPDGFSPVGSLARRVGITFGIVGTVFAVSTLLIGLHIAKGGEA